MADDFDNENTIGEIEPTWEKKFNVAWVRDLVKNTTDAFFYDQVYSPDNQDTNAVNAVLLARKIRDKLRESGRLKRYKINVQTFIGERKDQKVSIVAKGFWDNYLDNYATYNLMGDNFYCSVIAWGFYTD